MTAADIGKTYFGPGNQRVRVIEVDRKNVRVQYPLSLNERVMSTNDFARFVKGSDLRTYHLQTRQGLEIRTKVEAFTVKKDDPRTLLDKDAPGFMLAGDYVTYMTPMRERRTVPQREWTAWRKRVQD